jgi:hypothetical protein
MKSRYTNAIAQLCQDVPSFSQAIADTILYHLEKSQQPEAGTLPPGELSANMPLTDRILNTAFSSEEDLSRKILQEHGYTLDLEGKHHTFCRQFISKY